MSKFSRATMFITSYIPLYLILIILNINFKYVLSGVNYLYYSGISMTTLLDLFGTWTLSDYCVTFLILLTIFSLFYLRYLLRNIKNYREPIVITDIKNRNDEILNYLLVYILSFINSSFSDFSKANFQSVTAFFLLILFIGYLYIDNKMIHINPTLNIIFKLNIYEVNTPRSRKFLLSSKKYDELVKLKDKNIQVHPFTEYIYLLEENKK